jgi:Tol biopolymer transport system component
MHDTRRPTKLSAESRPSVHRYYDVPCESPDGRAILYFTFDGPVPGPGSVMVADRDGSNPRTVARAEGACLGHVGAQATWIDDDTIHYTPGGDDDPASRFVSLASGETRDMHGWIRAYHESTGQAAVLMGDATKESDEFAKRRRPRVDRLDVASGSVQTILTIADAAAVHPRRNDIDPARMNFMNTKWSPDGSTLSVVFTDQIYHSLFGGTTTVKCLILVDADGGNPRYLGEFAHHPLWSPDGSFVLAHRKREDSQDLVALPVDGREPYVLLRDFVGIHSSLDRAMRRVVTDAYRFPEQGAAAVLLYELDSGRREILCQASQTDFDHKTGSHVHPQWSRDERRILFNMTHTGTPALYALDVD